MTGVDELVIGALPRRPHLLVGRAISSAAVVAALLGVSATGCGQTIAAGGTSTPPPSTASAERSTPASPTVTPSLEPPIDWAAEERVLVAANIVTRYANTHAAAGYTNVIVNGRAATITVYWKGPVPAALRRELATAAPRVTATFHTAPYEQTTLHRATQRLHATYGTATFTPLGIAVHSCGPSSDGQGVNVSYATLPGRTAAAADLIRRAIEHITRVPVVHLEHGEPPRPTTAGPAVADDSAR